MRTPEWSLSHSGVICIRYESFLWMYRLRKLPRAVDPSARHRNKESFLSVARHSTRKTIPNTIRSIAAIVIKILVFTDYSLSKIRVPRPYTHQRRRAVSAASTRMTMIRYCQPVSTPVAK